jgi:hypothetical protein
VNVVLDAAVMIFLEDLMISDLWITNFIFLCRQVFNYCTVIIIATGFNGKKVYI